MIYVFLADGFEEVEALTSVDLLRRADLNVQIVGVGNKTITGSHKISVLCDIIDNEILLNNNLEMIVLPGGMPGTINLEKSNIVQSAIKYCDENRKYIGAICAAPSILGHLGLLKGKDSVCFEGFETQLLGANVLYEPVVVSDNIITGRSAGCSINFALKLVEVLTSKERAKTLGESLLWE